MTESGKDRASGCPTRGGNAWEGPGHEGRKGILGRGGSGQARKGVTPTLGRVGTAGYLGELGLVRNRDQPVFLANFNFVHAAR